MIKLSHRKKGLLFLWMAFLVYWCAEAHCEQLCICRRRCAGCVEFSPTSWESADAVWQPHSQQGKWDDDLWIILLQDCPVLCILFCSVFIAWTKWTLAMALPWWQHYKYCRGYYYILLLLLLLLLTFNKKQVWMYYRSGTFRCCCIGAGRCFLFIHQHQMASLFCVKWHHDHLLDSVTSNWKSNSANRCLYLCIPTRIIPIRFETTEP